MPLLFNKEQSVLPIINDIAVQYNVPVALILAHIKQESNFDPKAYRAEPAINDASYGLMQVLLKTAKMFVPTATVDQMYDATFNINVGTVYIAKNLNRYDGNIQDAIAAYNAGSAIKNADGKYTSSKGNTIVQSYVDKVYKNYLNYDNWLNEGANVVDVDYSIIVGGVVLTGVLLYIWKRS